MVTSGLDLMITMERKRKKKGNERIGLELKVTKVDIQKERRW